MQYRVDMCVRLCVGGEPSGTVHITAHLTGRAGRIASSAASAGGEAREGEARGALPLQVSPPVGQLVNAAGQLVCACPTPTEPHKTTNCCLSCKLISMLHSTGHRLPLSRLNCLLKGVCLRRQENKCLPPGLRSTTSKHRFGVGEFL